MQNSLIIPPMCDAKNILFFTTRLFDKEPINFVKEKFYDNAILYMPAQKHTDFVLDLDFEVSNCVQIADAVITNKVGLFIGVKTADCVPILIVDKKRSVISAIHAGWRGTAKGIVIKTVQKMINSYSCKAEDLMVSIGPSVKMCCYEVDYDVFSRIRDVTGEGSYYKEQGDKFYLDLPLSNKMQLKELGVRTIWISEDCTCCQKDLYHSYRRDKEKALRQYAIIGIVNPKSA